MNRTIMYHWLNSVKEFSPEEKQRLLNEYGIEEVYARGKQDFKDQCMKSFEEAINRKICILCPEDEDYPEELREIYTPPLCLYYIGELPKGKTLAVVGSRNCSDYGIRMANYFGGGLAKAGVNVISGMARGIDGAAQRAALDARGKVFAVLGSGVDVVYPRENRDIYDRIIKTGGVLSEVPPGEAPIATNFPKRNRIISALSSGILLIEASFRSGSLITVNYGLEQGREVMAVPGRIDDRLSEGCLDVIKSGATPVTSVKDVLFSMNFADCTKDK